MVDAPPITNLRPAVPAHVAGALQRALAKNPADRFNPMAQFSAALHADGVHADSASAGAAVAAGAAAAAAVSRAAEPNQAKPSRWRAWAALGLALAIIGAVFAYKTLRPDGSGTNGDSNGIAILPFSDLSPDHADAYLGDGIAETLISALANVNGLTVAARTSAFSFRNRSDDLKSIGRSLNVSTVLEGSVQRAGDRLRVTTRLVKVSDGRTLWSKTFDRATADIFAVQDEVVREVVTAIQGSRVAVGAQIGPAVGTRDREAYDLYLQGTFLLNRRSLPDIERAATLFERAIGRDSAFASAWSGLADARLLKCFVSTVNSLEQLPTARLAADWASG